MCLWGSKSQEERIKVADCKLKRQEKVFFKEEEDPTFIVRAALHSQAKFRYR